MAGPNRPSPRKLSRLFMRGQDGLTSKENRTALLAFFGQVVTNEIVMASESGCPIEMHRIEVERCDEMYDKDCRGDRYIPFHRALYDRNTGQSPNAPREQVFSLLIKIVVVASVRMKGKERRKCPNVEMAVIITTLNNSYVHLRLREITFYVYFAAQPDDVVDRRKLHLQHIRSVAQRDAIISKRIAID
jgi:hypothetical protein